MNMQTAKALGFKKGDFVHTGTFPGIVIGDVDTATPRCEVFGLEHEIGSAYLCGESPSPALSSSDSDDRDGLSFYNSPHKSSSLHIIRHPSVLPAGHHADEFSSRTALTTPDLFRGAVHFC